MGAYKRRDYTEKDDAFIEDHFNRWSVRKIAEGLGRSESSVRAHAKRLGLVRVQYEPPRVEETSALPGGRLSRLLALRDLVEGEILGDDLPVGCRPSFYREYRAILAEISELEGKPDGGEHEEGSKNALAEGLARLADMQQKLLERAGEP